MIFWALLFYASFFCLAAGVLLLKKSDCEQNLIVWIPVSLLLVLCLEALFAGVLNLIHIPINLITMSLINIALIAPCLLYRLKTGEFQKFIVPRIDLIALGIIAATTFILALIQFGLHFDINFGTTDPAAHLLNAIYIATDGNLSPMYLSHLPTAMAVQTATPFLPITQYYKAFIVLEVFYQFLAGAVFFSAAKRFAPTKNATIILIILTLLYMGGYPLNNLFYGFSYLGLSISVVALVYFGLGLYQKREVYSWCSTSILMLALFGLIISYALFVPIVFTAVLIFLVLFLRKKGKVLTRKNVLLLLYLFVPAIILGFLYTYRGFFGGDMAPSTAIGMDGDIYRELYSDFLFIAPLALYALFVSIKSRELSFGNILFYTLSLVMIAGLIAGLAGFVSVYYFFKTHYLMWLVTFMLATKGLVKLMRVKGPARNFALVYCSLVLALVLFAVADIERAILGINQRFIQVPLTILDYPQDAEHRVIESKSRLSFYIYVFNYHNIATGPYLDPDEFALFEKAFSLLDDSYIPAVVDGYQFSWYHTITLQSCPRDFTFDMDFWPLMNILNQSEYFVVFYGVENEKDLTAYLNRGGIPGEVIFETPRGYIYQTTN